MALNTKTFRSGALRHPVDIEQKVKVDDGQAGSTTTWTAFLSNQRVAIEELLVGSREIFDNQQEQFRETHLVTMRKVPGSRPTHAMRVNHGGRLLYIERVIEKDSNSQFLILGCVERAE